MIPELLRGQCYDGRGEEHGFVIRMGDEQADPLVGQWREGGPRNVGGEEPACCEEDGNGESDIGLRVHGR